MLRGFAAQRRAVIETYFLDIVGGPPQPRNDGARSAYRVRFAGNPAATEPWS